MTIATLFSSIFRLVLIGRGRYHVHAPHTICPSISMCRQQRRSDLERVGSARALLPATRCPAPVHRGAEGAGDGAEPPVAARGRAADAPRSPRPVAERVVGGRGYAASKSHVICSSVGSRAAARGGGAVGSPRWVKILETAPRSVTVARIEKRPSHLGHWSESAQKVRRTRRCPSDLRMSCTVLCLKARRHGDSIRLGRARASVETQAASGKSAVPQVGITE